MNKASKIRLNSVADPDLQIRGRGGGHPDPEIRERGPVSKIYFSALRASFWSKNKGGPGPFPGSATVILSLKDQYRIVRFIEM